MLKFVLLTILLLTLSLSQANKTQFNTSYNSVNSVNSVNSASNDDEFPEIKKQSRKFDKTKDQIIYTEDIQIFKGSEINRRMQTVIGCMVISSNYIKQTLNSEQTNAGILNFDFLNLGSNDNEQIEILKNSISISDEDKLFLMKKCMKKIKRKEAIAAITSIASRNIERVLTLPQFLDEAERKEIKRIQLIKTITPIYYSLYLSNKTQFDFLLLQYLNKFTSELKDFKSKSKLEKTLNEELKKRTYHYFGFIPANQFTHTVILMTFSTSIVLCCTCYKYSKKRQEATLLKRKEKLFHNHSVCIQQKKATKKKVRKIQDIQ